MHRGKERDERDAQRAKDEVARLNGVVVGAGSNSGDALNPAASSSAAGASKSGSAASAPKRQATVEDRKRQMAQLAAMGVAVPEEYRKEMAMVGEWQVVARHELSKPKREPEEIAGSGERKRKFQNEQDDEEEDEEEIPAIRKGWGRAFKSFPGSKTSNEDIGALLGAPIKLKSEAIEEEGDIDEIKAEGTVKEEQPSDSIVKDEPSEDAIGIDETAPVIKDDGLSTKEVPPPTVVFKKRKAKPIKEK
jgi:hypothetical protein